MILWAFERPIVKRGKGVFLKIEMYVLHYRDDSNYSKKVN